MGHRVYCEPSKLTARMGLDAARSCSGDFNTDGGPSPQVK